MSADQPEVLKAARRYLAAGLSVIPIKADGSKTPVYSGWRDYSTRIATDAELTKWFCGSVPAGVGVVPGPASGNLVVLDFEHKGGTSAYAEWRAGLDPVAAVLLASCPIVRTPSGGRHVWVRLPESVPGGKLARFAAGTTKIEIRGLGHQVLAPGCPPECHKDKLTYEFEQTGWLKWTA